MYAYIWPGRSCAESRGLRVQERWARGWAPCALLIAHLLQKWWFDRRAEVSRPVDVSIRRLRVGRCPHASSGTCPAFSRMRHDPYFPHKGVSGVSIVMIVCAVRFACFRAGRADSATRSRA